MKIQSWSWKAPVLLASVLVIGWGLADAMELSILPRHSQLPTIRELLDTDDAGALLRQTHSRSVSAADLLARCLLHEHRGLRQAARTVAHERLDAWALDSTASDERMVVRLSGTLRQILERSPGNVPLSAEAEDITTRILKAALRPTFGDRESCVTDCQTVLVAWKETGVSRPSVVPANHVDPVVEEAKRSIVAPIEFETTR